MSDFKVGEVVAIKSSGWRGCTITTHAIERETPTLYVLDNGRRFYKKNNRVYGDGFDKVEKLTDELRDRIKLQYLTIGINNVIYDMYEKRNKFRASSNIKELECVLRYLTAAKNLLLKSEVESE
jgi:hypothetical protein